MKQRLYSERVLLGGRGTPFAIEPALLEIEDGLLISVIPSSRDSLSPHQKANLMDLNDVLITPAFVNCHTHLSMIAFRGIGGLSALKNNVVSDLYFHLEKHLTARDVLLFSRLGAIEALSKGCGLVWDHYYHGEAVAQALQEVGLCGVVSPTLQDLGGPGQEMLEQAWNTTLDIHSDQTLRNDGILAAFGPHATDTVSDALWHRVAQKAERLHLPIHCHLAQSIDEFKLSMKNHQCTPVQRLHRLNITSLHVPRVWAHGLFVTNDDLDVLDPALDTLAHCPAAQIQFAFPAHVNSWRDKRMNIVLGTDSPSCNDSINLQAEMKLYAAADSYGVTMGDTLNTFRRKGGTSQANLVHTERQLIYDLRAPHTSPSRLLSTVWGNAANLHPLAPVGSIQRGHWANLLFWDAEHSSLWPMKHPLQSLAFGDTSPALMRIMLRGKMLFDGVGSLAQRIERSPQVAAWKEEASGALDDLYRRLNV